jgi:predicted Rossmann-fold nucleotide-binding protein
MYQQCCEQCNYQAATWVVGLLNHISHFPVICMGTEYWSPLIDFFRTSLLANDAIKEEDLEIITVTDSIDEARATPTKMKTLHHGAWQKTVKMPLNC